MRKLTLEIAGLGIVLYSPAVLGHVPEGSNFYQDELWEAEDVARNLTQDRLVCFSTGSPGIFHLTCIESPPNASWVEAAKFRLRFGLAVRGNTVCIRDIFDLTEWTAGCPQEQQMLLDDGWYRLTVLSSPTPDGEIGLDQEIVIYFERASRRPAMRFKGMPLLGEVL